MIDPAVPAVLRGALALLFASAAVHKLRDLPAFRVALEAYELLPGPLTRLGAPALVAAEFGTMVLLLSPAARPWGFAAAGLLLAVYTAAIGVNLLRGRLGIDCGCFGPALRLELSAGLLARNALLLAGALVGCLPPTPRPLAGPDALPVLAAVGFLALAYAAASRLLANAPALRPLRSEP